MNVWASGRLWQDKGRDLADVLMVLVRDGTLTHADLTCMLQACAGELPGPQATAEEKRVLYRRALVFRAASLDVQLRAYNDPEARA